MARPKSDNVQRGAMSRLSRADTRNCLQTAEESSTLLRKVPAEPLCVGRYHPYFAGRVVTVPQVRAESDAARLVTVSLTDSSTEGERPSAHTSVACHRKAFI